MTQADAQIMTQCDVFRTYKGLSHGFFTASGSQDESALKLGCARRAVLKQVHSPDVVEVTQEPFDVPLPQADALVTKCKDVALSVITADCGPVLFADPAAGVIAAAHAGWRGALYGVLENTVEAMTRLGAKQANILAALGPCIHQDSYQVGAEMRDEFMSTDQHANPYFISDPSATGKFLFDLPGYILNRLSRDGIEATGWVAHDTYTHLAYNSYRRATHQGLSSGGRQLSVIAMNTIT